MKATIMPMFLHLRDHDVISYNATTNEAVLEILPTGGCTVAFTYTPHNELSGTVRFAAAFCSHKDHYNKRVGRAKAAGRLKSDKLSEEFVIDEQATIKEVINNIKERIYQRKEQFDSAYRVYVF